MDRLVNLRYWESMAGYIITGLVFLWMIICFVYVYYREHDTPLQKIKKKLKQKKEAQDGDGTDRRRR